MRHMVSVLVSEEADLRWGCGADVCWTIFLVRDARGFNLKAYDSSDGIFTTFLLVRTWLGPSSSDIQTLALLTASHHTHPPMSSPIGMMHCYMGMLPSLLIEKRRINKFRLELKVLTKITLCKNLRWE